MKGFDTTWLNSQIARNQRGPALDEPESKNGVEREADLHNSIIAHCRANRWYFVHSRTDKSTTQAKGVADFILFLPKGRVVCIECKRKGGKLSPEQNIVRHVLRALEHDYFVVFDFAQFLAAVTPSIPLADSPH